MDLQQTPRVAVGGSIRLCIHHPSIHTYTRTHRIIVAVMYQGSLFLYTSNTHNHSCSDMLRESFLLWDRQSKVWCVMWSVSIYVSG